MIVASAQTARRLTEAGALVGGLGGLVVCIGMATGLFAESGAGQARTYGRRRDRWFHLVGSFLIGLGFLILLIGLHSK